MNILEQVSIYNVVSLTKHWETELVIPMPLKILEKHCETEKHWETELAIPMPSKISATSLRIAFASSGSKSHKRFAIALRPAALDF